MVASKPTRRVDIPNVALVANANVPPSVSNYRQRVGRAGRRGEPWAFATTFCRDLPLDHVVFQNPLKFLMARIAAPAVRLDSAPVVARHVHAALLGAFLRTSSDGLNIKTSIGAFFGATLRPSRQTISPIHFSFACATRILVMARRIILRA